MKNTRIYVAAMAVAMLFVTSCKKEESSVKQEFSATMEVSKSGEKTNLVNDQLQWAHGSDKVSITSISGNSYITSTFTANTHTAYPNNLSYANLDLDQDQTELAEGDGVTYRSIYPASISSENNTQVILPRVQASTSGELTGYPMYAESSNKSLQFWNLCSVLKLSLTGTERISKIEVVTDKYINGTFTINYQNDNQPLSPTTVTNHTKMTTLTMSTPVQLSSEASYFYIYLPVQQYKYIKINFYNQNNLVYSKAASITNGVTLERSKYHPIAFSTPTFKPSVLCGEFSVSSTKKVSFSKGNLLLTASNETYSTSYNSWDILHVSPIYSYTSNHTYKFADQQYDKTEGNYEWLYDWGIKGTSSNRNAGVETVFFERWKNYSGNNHTHTASISNGGSIDWRCLTQPEWDYVLKYTSRMSFYDRNGVLQNSSTNRAFTLGTVNGIHGLLLFPDIFYWPIDNKYPSQFGVGSSWNSINLTVEEWKVLEGAGCVFLPTTGTKSSTSSLANENSKGVYWSSSKFDYSTARYLDIAAITAFADDRHYDIIDEYCTLRLVKDNNNNNNN